jgi:antagonist of KipI
LASVSILIQSPGLLTTIQDAGRHGHAAIGVGPSGAMDTVSLRLANLLVGNAQTAAAIEMTLRGPRLRFESDMLIAITGADIDVRYAGATVPMWRPLAVRAGCEFEFGTIRQGARSYLACAGGIETAQILGSRSSDLNAGLGGVALTAGDHLATAGGRVHCPGLWHRLDRGQSSIAMSPWSLDPQPWFDFEARRIIHIVAGAHFPHLDIAAQRALFAQEFRIGADSNRVGYRLGGATLELREPLELVSEGVVAGTIQLPPGGNPIVLMAEAPTCGGYPRIGHVTAVDLPLLAQRRPGDAVRFAEVSLADAQTRYLQRERALARLADTVRQRLDG